MVKSRTIISGTSRYIKSRREALRRSKQIKEKNGPASMEWVQSALFLYACKKYGLRNDLRRALLAYTSSMIVKLEEVLTQADRIASRDNTVDSYLWAAKQLRWAINKHLTILETMQKEKDIVIPKPTKQGAGIQRIVSRPSKRDSFDSMTYIVGEFKDKNPDAVDVIPKRDEDTNF